MVAEIVRRPSESVPALPCPVNADSDSLKEVVSISSVDEDDEGFACNSIALNDNEDNCNAPTFGNIAVSNSADVHFGNKTYYQGPVTIKKIVYAGADAALPEAATNGTNKCVNGLDNVAYSGENCEKPEKPNESNEQTYKKLSIKQLKHHKPLVITIIVCALAIIVIGILLSVLLKDAPNRHPLDDGDQTFDNPLDPVDLPGNKLKIVTRREWLAQSPLAPLDKLPTPVPYVIIMHTATENCSTQSDCTFSVKQIQNFHIDSRKWWDIAYNFLVGGDGYVYEGRGWTSEGSHTYLYNKNAIGIAFVGTFISQLPPKRQINAAKRLIEMGVNESYIKADYILLAARDVSSTESPGNRLYEDVKTWPHWSKTP